MKSAEQKLAEFRRLGLSVRQWANQNGFSPTLVYRVLAGSNPQRGQSHNIAVALGIKEGELNQDDSYQIITERAPVFPARSDDE